MKRPVLALAALLAVQFVTPAFADISDRVGACLLIRNERNETISFTIEGWRQSSGDLTVWQLGPKSVSMLASNGEAIKTQSGNWSINFYVGLPVGATVITDQTRGIADSVMFIYFGRNLNTAREESAGCNGLWAAMVYPFKVK